MQGIGNKCIKEVDIALPTLHRAELLKEHGQVMEIMVMHSTVTHLGRNGWDAILLKGMEALRWIIRTQKLPCKNSTSCCPSL